MRAYEEASDRGQTSVATDARASLALLLSEVLGASESLEAPGVQAADRARAFFLRGRLQEATADASSDEGAASLTHAEEALKKAAKLNPAHDGAWNCLGQLFWKRGNLDGAKNCYQAVLKRGQNKKTLQAMSMLCRNLAKSKAAAGSDEQRDYVAQSMEHAKAAVKMDLTDGYSWYQVGMAYMSQFFAEGASDQTKLGAALKAYASAEKGGPAGDGSSGGGGIGDYPDLHFNRAIVLRYCEDYGPALDGFRTAARLDPGLPWKTEVDAIVSVLARLDDGCRAMGPMFKPKRIAPIVKALEGTGHLGNETPKGYTAASLGPEGALKAGTNQGVAVNVRAVLDATSEDRMNLHYIVVDREGTLAALSVYGLEDGAVRLSATLSLLNPVVREVDAMWEGRRFNFRLIRVDLPKQILVAGQMPVGRIARPRLASTNL